MAEYLMAIVKALYVIHQENMVVLSTISSRDIDDKYIKPFDDAFQEAIKGVVKNDK